jgi:hypothetical protein
MKKLLFAIVLASSAAACHHDDAKREVVAQKDAERILEETPWLDRAPQAEEDVIHAYVFQGEGIYFTGNSYKWSIERFRYYAEQDLLKVRFLDDGAKHDLHYKIERVSDRVFDYKLTLDGDPRGPSVYYGFDSHRALPDTVRALLADLPK